MAKKSIFRLIVAVGAMVVLALAAPNAALAQPPNDDFASATTITSLPFSTTEDTSQATWDPSDPSSCASSGSVWFAFTPSSNMQIDANTFGSSYDTVLSAWTGTQGSLSLVACNDDFSGFQSRIGFQASAGTTYYFLVAVCCGSGFNGGGNLQLSVSQVLPPTNDNFADAKPIASLPFSDTKDLSAATTEPAEPSPPGCFFTSNTVWYSFTPATTQSVTATINEFGAEVAAYTGSSLSSLSQVGCTPYYFQPLTFRAQAGTTYWLQLGAWCCGVGQVSLSLNVAPNPFAQLSYSPSDPSVFDTIQFYDNSNDPAGAGFSSWAWDFGDGGTSTQQNPTHRYGADGDYTVRLTVTTSDGRTASTSRVVPVRTHDVAITRLAVPKSAHVNETVAVNVYVKNTRYPETVQVTLSKSIPGGFAQVGTLTQSVPVKTGGQSTRFAFTYTVTSDDKAVGKITFRADAVLTAHQDALPADNTLLSTPVKIG